MGNSVGNPACRCDDCRLSFLTSSDGEFHNGVHICSHCQMKVRDYVDLQIHLVTECANVQQLFARTRGLSYMAFSNDVRSQAKYEERASIIAEFKEYVDARRGSLSTFALINRLYESKVQTERSVYVFGGDLTAAMPLCIEVGLRMMHNKQLACADLDKCIKDAVTMDAIRPGDGTFQRAVGDHSRYQKSIQVVGELKGSTKDDSVIDDLMTKLYAYHEYTTVVAILRRKLDMVAVCVRRDGKIALFDPCLPVSELPSNAIINMLGAGILYFNSIDNVAQHLNRSFPYVAGRDENQDKLFNAFEFTVYRESDWEWEDLEVEVQATMFSPEVSQSEDERSRTCSPATASRATTASGRTSPATGSPKASPPTGSAGLKQASPQSSTMRFLHLNKELDMDKINLVEGSDGGPVTCVSTPCLDTPSGYDDAEVTKLKEEIEAERRENGALRQQVHDLAMRLKHAEGMLGQQAEQFDAERDELITNFNASKWHQENQMHEMHNEIMHLRERLGEGGLDADRQRVAGTEELQEGFGLPDSGGGDEHRHMYINESPNAKVMPDRGAASSAVPIQRP